MIDKKEQPGPLNISPEDSKKEDRGRQEDKLSDMAESKFNDNLKDGGKKKKDEEKNHKTPPSGKPDEGQEKKKEIELFTVSRVESSQSMSNFPRGDQVSTADDRSPVGTTSRPLVSSGADTVRPPLSSSPSTGRPFSSSPVTIRPFSSSPITIRPFSSSPITIRPFPSSPLTTWRTFEQQDTIRPSSGSDTGRLPESSATALSLSSTPVTLSSVETTTEAATNTSQLVSTGMALH